MSVPEGRSSSHALSLALQGGGAWGAYTWGVLDRLLARRGIGIEQISGTSAGALNGAIVASALAGAPDPDAGRWRAREALASFWHEMAADRAHDPMRLLLGPWGAAMSDQLGQWMLGTGTVSPYQANPLNLNPLRKAIADHVDIDAIRALRGPRLFVTATNVRTGLPRVFGSAEMSVDVLMASACLPQIFQAVEIDGEPYWDGGYCGNPSIWPLLHDGRAHDIVLVQLAANVHPQLPRTAAEIRQRIGELMFSSSLVAEMQAIHAMRGSFARAGVDAPVLHARFHRVGPPPARDEGEAAGGSLDRSWRLLLARRDQGRRAASRFFALHRDALGRRSTLDLAATFMDPRKPKLRLAVPPAREDRASRLAG